MMWFTRPRHAAKMTKETWLASAPSGLVGLFRMLTPHWKVRWDAPDYATDKEITGGKPTRQIAPTLEDAEAISSLRTDPWSSIEPTDRHALLIDIDVPAWLIPSSTEGHSHLVVDLSIKSEDLWDFLEAAVKIGLIEEGYYNACKERGMTSLRLPWITKGQEPSFLAYLARQEAESKAYAEAQLVKSIRTEPF